MISPAAWSWSKGVAGENCSGAEFGPVLLASGGARGPVSGWRKYRHSWRCLSNPQTPPGLLPRPPQSMAHEQCRGADPREMCMLRVRYGWDVCYGYVTGWSEGGIERRCQTLGDGPHWNRGWDRAASLDAGRGASVADLGVEELRPRRRTLPRTRLSADRCADTGWSCQPRGAGKEKGV